MNLFATGSKRKSVSYSRPSVPVDRWFRNGLKLWNGPHCVPEVYSVVARGKALAPAFCAPAPPVVRNATDARATITPRATAARVLRIAMIASPFSRLRLWFAAPHRLCRYLRRTEVSLVCSSGLHLGDTLQLGAGIPPFRGAHRDRLVSIARDRCRKILVWDYGDSERSEYDRSRSASERHAVPGDRLGGGCRARAVGEHGYLGFRACEAADENPWVGAVHR